MDGGETAGGRGRQVGDGEADAIASTEDGSAGVAQCCTAGYRHCEEKNDRSEGEERDKATEVAEETEKTEKTDLPISTSPYKLLGDGVRNMAIPPQS